MFSYMLKTFPAQYIFAGYAVRRSISVVSTMIDGVLTFDVFSYIYLDNQLSMFLEMESGKYKSCEYGVDVDAYDGEAIMSKHLYRGLEYKQDDYPMYNKEEIVGVFGLRNMEELMKVTDDFANESGMTDMKVQAMLDVKRSYSGMEVMGVINKFNRINGWKKNTITVPAIVNGPEDTFKSVIGDDLDFFDFLSNKGPDKIVRELKKLDDSTDGIGNLLEENEETEVL